MNYIKHFYYYIVRYGLYFMIYYFSKNNDISLFISSSIFIILSVYKIINNLNKTFNMNEYRILLLLLILTIKYVIDNYNNVNFKLINFGLVLYIFLSELEYNINKYILNCETNEQSNPQPYITKPDALSVIRSKIPDPSKVYRNKITDYLKNHNMLDLCKNNEINYQFYIRLLIVVLICIYIAYLCGDYKISYKNMLLLGFIITTIWVFFWKYIYIKKRNNEYYNKLFLGNDEWINPT